MFLGEDARENWSIELESEDPEAAADKIMVMAKSYGGHVTPAELLRRWEEVGLDGV
jgi:hypothetical protein